MTIRDEARQEAERRWPEWLQAAKRDWLRGAFEAGAVWASEQADRGCGHPNHGAEAHDCAPFLPDREPSDAEVLCECGFSEDLHDGEFDAACGAFRPDREPSDAEEVARLRLERLEAVEDFITRHYLDTQMGERVLAIVNGIEEVRRADAS